VASAHPDNTSVRSLAASAVRRADPADPVVERVANVVLNGDPGDRDSYYYRLLLDQLISGMTPNNAEKRVGMVAAKLRHAAQKPSAVWFVPDIARLSSDLGEDDRHLLVVISHYLARILVRAHALGVPSRRLLDSLAEIPGE
ncbi:hypothetical protein, partial [Streptomyces sp. NPDC058418]|uniref:hypothetical protein n=1 Tax=Streptomyces sp. NPDC058418 TaxID=3346488 RepID=UPI00364BBC35